MALDFALASPHSLHIRIALATGLGHSSIRGGGQTPLSLSHQPPPGSKRTCTCEREPCTCVDFVLYRYTCIGFARDKGTWDIHAHKGSSALSSSRLAQPRSPYGPPEPSRRYITHILWGGAKKEWPKSDEFSKIIINYPPRGHFLPSKHAFTPIRCLHTVTTGSGGSGEGLFGYLLRLFHVLIEIYPLVPFPPSVREGMSDVRAMYTHSAATSGPAPLRPDTTDT